MQQASGTVLMSSSAQREVPDLLLGMIPRVVMWHINSHPTGPPVSGITGFTAKEKQSSEWAPPSSNYHCGPVTSEYYANPNHWSNWVTFCSGSDSKTQRPYCECIFVRTIPARSVSQITVLKVQKYASKATCQVEGARITDRRHLTGNPPGLGKGAERWEETEST